MIRKAIIVVLSLLAASAALLIPINANYPQWRIGSTHTVWFAQPDGSRIGLPNGFRVWGGRVSYTWFGQKTSTPRRYKWLEFAAFEFRDSCHGDWVEVGSTMTGEPIRSLWCLPQIDVHIPLVGVLLVSAPYPFMAFFRGPYRRWRRPRKGLCVNCGYNLTGNESGVCPECGSEVEQA